MKDRRHFIWLLALTGGGLLLAGLGLSGCDQQLPTDRLYALHLNRPPSDSDWQRALPHQVTVRGGRLHKTQVFPDIDKDTVHTSTPSCHHGGSLPKPLTVEMRAFYTDRDLYLRLRWTDRTRDDAMDRWQFTGTGWSNDHALEDGFGLMWQPAAHRDEKFSCARACHIDDFGVARSTFHATNKMRLAQPGDWTDLWNWKADRTGRFGFADDRYLDEKGMHGDTPGELLRENSRFRLAGDQQAEPFAEGDAPVYDAEANPVGQHFYPPGTTAPGWLTDLPVGPRADLAARSQWRDGHWTVILRRKLDTGDPRDVVFRVGRQQAVEFGLSVMDNSLNEHYASTSEEQLVLLPPEAGRTVRSN